MLIARIRLSAETLKGQGKGAPENGENYIQNRERIQYRHAAER
jgi:hypothetical protein